ncbi:MAG: outer membrane beta-barrel protein [Bacteroidales bacterium]|nr:outer membrane beta-barrel protein [Bacteroidales bacterium]
MKRILLVLLGLSLFSFANAQHFGIHAGPEMSTMKMETDIIEIKTNLKPGFFVGLTVDFPLNNKMLLNTSINYKTAGTSIDNGPLIDENTKVLVIKTDNISFDLTYNYVFPLNSIELYAEGGGYLGYAISGKMAYTPKEGEKYNETLKLGSEKTDDLRAFDAGLIIGAGVYLNKFQFGLGYQYGLNNLSTSEDVQDAIKNRSYYATIGYLFNRK